MWFFLCKLCNQTWTIFSPNSSWEGLKYCPMFRQDATIFVREILPGPFYGIWEWDITQLMKECRYCL
jgi:hypothetical protein